MPPRLNAHDNQMTNATQTAMEDNDGHEEPDIRRRIHLREISGEADSSVDSIGQDLRNARLRRGDEIAAVSRALKIRKDHLEALEDDRPEDLPGRTYALGFVRSYAQYLGLDANEFAARYKHDAAGRAAEEEPQLTPIHEEEWRLPQGWWVIAAILVVLLGYGAWYLLAGGQDNSQTVPPAPALIQQQSQSQSALPKPVVVPMQGQAQPASVLGSAASNGDSQAGSELAAMPAPAAGPQTPATHIDSPIAAQSPVATASTDAASGPAVPPQGEVYGQQNASPRVIIRAQGATRVTVRGTDGELYINRDLKPGDIYRVPNLTGLNLAVADAGAIDIELDGQQLGPVGQPGQVLGRVSLNPQALMDRFNR